VSDIVVIDTCMNCGCQIEPVVDDGQGEIWCDECVAKEFEDKDGGDNAS